MLAKMPGVRAEMTSSPQRSLRHADCKLGIAHYSTISDLENPVTFEMQRLKSFRSVRADTHGQSYIDAGRAYILLGSLNKQAIHA